MKSRSLKGPIGPASGHERSAVKRGTRGGRRRGRWVGGISLLICVVVGALAVADHLANARKIHNGVEAGSVNLGGKSPAEAREIVEKRVTGPLKEIELEGPGDFARTAGQMGVEFRVEDTVRKAYAVGREGNVLERLIEWMRAAYGSVSITPRVDYQPGVARGELEEVSSRLNNAPRNASMSIEGSEVRVAGSREGYRMDLAATMRNLRTAVEDMSGEVEIAGETIEPEIYTPAAKRAAEKARAAMSGPLVLKAQGQQWSLEPAQVGESLDVSRDGKDVEVNLNRERLEQSLADVFSSLNVETVEADYAVEGSTVTVRPGQTGQSVQTGALIESIGASIFEGQRTYQVPLATEKPKLTTAEAQRLKPTRRIGTYRTRYVGTGDSSRARVENLRIASNAIDGTMVAPGEVFSANDILAPLDYRDAKVIIDGKVESALGGGLCQIASTVYMAVNYAGLDVIERYPHHSELSYIRPGLDSTVWFGAANGYSGQELDMKFRNTSEGYVMVREYVADDGYLYAEVWGQPTGREVTMDSRRVSASRRQTEWVTHQTVERGGEVLFDGVLHRDTYEPLTDEDGERVPKSKPASVNP